MYHGLHIHPESVAGKARAARRTDADLEAHLLHFGSGIRKRNCHTVERVIGNKLSIFPSLNDVPRIEIPRLVGDAIAIFSRTHIGISGDMTGIQGMEKHKIKARIMVADACTCIRRGLAASACHLRREVGGGTCIFDGGTGAARRRRGFASERGVIQLGPFSAHIHLHIGTTGIGVLMRTCKDNILAHQSCPVGEAGCRGGRHAEVCHIHRGVTCAGRAVCTASARSARTAGATIIAIASLGISNVFRSIGVVVSGSYTGNIIAHATGTARTASAADSASAAGTCRTSRNITIHDGSATCIIISNTQSCISAVFSGYTLTCSPSQ